MDKAVNYVRNHRETAEAYLENRRYSFTKSGQGVAFRFHLTIDTLAVQLCASALPTCTQGFHSLEPAHSGRTQKSHVIIINYSNSQRPGVILYLTALLFCGYPPLFPYLLIIIFPFSKNISQR